ncbi:hypothetical protein niasHT_038685 [Heterodera trifolii]|uniref:Uncharacterized protein n=1 Tax=Heterodera trifolii TaxID=157864 RepID=A0ABD2IAZ8_9BILA
MAGQQQCQCRQIYLLPLQIAVPNSAVAVPVCRPHRRCFVFMFLCCCVRLHRHQLHLASYGLVSMSLIITGFVFTVFAVFHRDNGGGEEENGQQNDQQPWDWIGRSRLGKIWLAGPVLMVVGGVLCGKVMIDWGPAMSRGRTGSLDSQLVDELVFSNLLPLGGGGAKSRPSLLINGTTVAPAEPSKVIWPLPTARFSCASATSDHFLLPSSADSFGAAVSAGLLPKRNILSCPLLTPPAQPPPLCAFFGSSSSCSKSSTSSNQKNGAAFNFDRIIYGPIDQISDKEDELFYDDETNETDQRAKIGPMMISNNMDKKCKLDKCTQSDDGKIDGNFYAGGGGCERCATFWPILEGKRSRSSSKSVHQNGTIDEADDEKRPKVIGKFVFAELLEKGGRKSPNYGTMVADNNGRHQSDNNANANVVELMDERSRSRGRACSQGETLIINERSFLI